MPGGGTNTPETAPQTWTVGRLIGWSANYLKEHGLDSPRLTAELMLAQVLDLTRVQLYMRFDQPLKPDELAGFKKLLLRRKGREPLAYILGRKEFYGLPFAVGPGVLIPRPETEHLVEEALARIKDLERLRVLDLCTGSGAVAAAIAHNHPTATVVGVDISERALDFARGNVTELGLGERVDLRLGSMYDPIAPGGGFFELITANPPYVAEPEWDALPPEVREFEPPQALLSGADGLTAVAQIIAGAGAFLRPQGWLMIELGQGQAQAAMGMAQGTGIFESVTTARDLAGIERVLICTRGDYG